MFTPPPPLISAAEISTYEQYTVLKIKCNYSDYQKIQPHFFRVGAVIDDTDFGESVTVILAVKDEVVQGFFDKIRESTSGRSVAEIVGQRFDYR